jgi:hypothetical protein
VVDTVYNRLRWDRFRAIMATWWKRQPIGTITEMDAAVKAEQQTLEYLGLVGRRRDREVGVNGPPQRDPTLEDIMAETVGWKGAVTREDTLQAIRLAKQAVKGAASKLWMLQQREDVDSVRTQLAIARQSSRWEQLSLNLRAAYKANAAACRSVRNQQRLAVEEMEANLDKLGRGGDRALQRARVQGAVLRTKLGVGRPTLMRPSPGEVISGIQKWLNFLPTKVQRVIRDDDALDQRQLEEIVCPPSFDVHVGDGRDAARQRLDSPFCVEELTRALRHMKATSAAQSTPILALQRLVGGGTAGPIGDDAACVAEGYLASFNAMLLGQAEVPDSFARVALTPVLKAGKDPGQCTSYRTLGVGSSQSRLLQVMIHFRLLEFVTSTKCLHPSQAGFLPHNSCELVAFLTQALQAEGARSQQSWMSLFLDIATAYPTTRYVDVARGMQRLGITGRLAKLVVQYLVKTRVYLTQEGFRTVDVVATLGLVEGLAMAPLLWNIVVDELLCRLVDKAKDLPVGEVPCGHECGTGIPRPLPAVAYADDIRIMAAYVDTLNTLLECTTAYCKEKELVLNVGPTKSAMMPSWDPRKADAGRAPEARHPRNAGVVLRVREAQVPVVEEYTHVGVHTMWSGPAPAATRHLEGLRKRVWGSLWGMRASGVVDVRPITALHARISRVRPQLTYAMAVWAPYVDLDPLQRLDDQVLSTVFDTPGMNVEVHQVLAQTVSLNTEKIAAVIRLILAVLGQDSDSVYKGQMQHMDTTLNRRRQGGGREEEGTWWWHAVQCLEGLDQLMSNIATRSGIFKNCPFDPEVIREAAAVGQRDSSGRLSVLSTVRWLLHRPGTVETAKAQLGMLRRIFPWLVSGVQWAAVRQRVCSLKTLDATQDLLNDPTLDGPLPFLRGPRTPAQMYRIQLRAGTYYLLGKDRERWRSRCPWCAHQTEPVSVPHLLRDCKFQPWVEDRRKVQQRMRQVAIDGGIMRPEQALAGDDGAPPDTGDLWYRLLVGAAVPLYFLRARTLFQDPTEPRRPAAGQRLIIAATELQTYGRIMEVSAGYLVKVLRTTQAAYGRTPSGCVAGFKVPSQWPVPPYPPGA